MLTPEELAEMEARLSEWIDDCAACGYALTWDTGPFCETHGVTVRMIAAYREVVGLAEQVVAEAEGEMPWDPFGAGLRFRIDNLAAALAPTHEGEPEPRKDEG